MRDAFNSEETTIAFTLHEFTDRGQNFHRRAYRWTRDESPITDRNANARCAVGEKPARSVKKGVVNRSESCRRYAVQREDWWR